MKLVDLTHLDWGVTHNGGVSYGCYYKATEVVNGKKYYYKCSNYYAGQGVFGDESVNEVICSRFLRILGFDAVKYTLLYAKIRLRGSIFYTYVCKSENFFVGYDSRSTLEYLCDSYKTSPVDMINKLGISTQIKNMLLADFLIYQRDRHGGNIEILLKNNKYTLSPLFDNGLGLLAPYPSAFRPNITNFDVLADTPVNNFIGTRSLYQNLSFINKSIRVNRLLKEDKKRIFYGLKDTLTDEYIDVIWRLLTYRYYFLRKRGFLVD